LLRRLFQKRRIIVPKSQRRPGEKEHDQSSWIPFENKAIYLPIHKCSSNDISELIVLEQIIQTIWAVGS